MKKNIFFSTLLDTLNNTVSKSYLFVLRQSKVCSIFCIITFLGVVLLSNHPFIANAKADIVENVRKIKIIKDDGRQAQATLLNNATAEEFWQKLPLTIYMGDHFQRELYGAMPSMNVYDRLQKTYKVGDIAYWPPAPGFAIYYKMAGPSIPGDGLALLGSIDDNVEIFKDGGGMIKVEQVE